jgi:hypothetical protein
VKSQIPSHPCSIILHAGHVRLNEVLTYIQQFFKSVGLLAGNCLLDKFSEDRLQLLNLKRRKHLLVIENRYPGIYSLLDIEFLRIHTRMNVHILPDLAWLVRDGEPGDELVRAIGEYVHLLALVGREYT